MACPSHINTSQGVHCHKKSHFSQFWSVVCLIQGAPFQNWSLTPASGGCSALVPSKRHHPGPLLCSGTNLWSCRARPHSLGAWHGDRAQGSLCAAAPRSQQHPADPEQEHPERCHHHHPVRPAGRLHQRPHAPLPRQSEWQHRQQRGRPRLHRRSAHSSAPCPGQGSEGTAGAGMGKNRVWGHGYLKKAFKMEWGNCPDLPVEAVGPGLGRGVEDPGTGCTSYCESAGDTQPVTLLSIG